MLLFGVATSIDLFEEKFSQSTSKSLYGARFNLAQIDIDVLFKAAVIHEHPQSILLGPGVSSLILQRHKDYIQSSIDFVRTLKVIATVNGLHSYADVLVPIYESLLQ